jgi:hypothetical protein
MNYSINLGQLISDKMEEVVPSGVNLNPTQVVPIKWDDKSFNMGQCVSCNSNSNIKIMVSWSISPIHNVT